MSQGSLLRRHFGRVAAAEVDSGLVGFLCAQDLLEGWLELKWEKAGVSWRLQPCECPDRVQAGGSWAFYIAAPCWGS